MSGASGSAEREMVAGIEQLLTAAMATGHAHLVITLGPASAWLVAQAAVDGLDLSGMAHAIDTSAIRHVVQQHGDERREIARGQLPVRRDDLLAIPQVLLTPDRVVFGLKNRRHQDQIAYLRRMADGTTLYIEEIRGARRRLSLASMRRFPGTIDATRLAATLDPHARSASRGELKIVDVPAGGKALDPLPSLGEG